MDSLDIESLEGKMLRHLSFFFFTASYLYKPIKLNAMTTGAVIFWAITFAILIVIQIKVMINDKKA